MNIKNVEKFINACNRSSLPWNLFWGGGFIFKVKTVKLPHNKSLALNTNCPFIFFNLFSHNYEGVMYKLSLDLLRCVFYIFLFYCSFSFILDFNFTNMHEYP